MKLGKRGLIAGAQDQFRVEEADGLKRGRNDVGLLKWNVVEDKLPVRSPYCLNCAEDNLCGEEQRERINQRGAILEGRQVIE